MRTLCTGANIDTPNTPTPQVSALNTFIVKICEWYTKTLTLIYKVYSHTIHIWLELPASSLICSFRLGVWAISRNLWINQDIFDILMLEKTIIA